jgi:2-oxo-3-hexenedioate decarboxylase
MADLDALAADLQTATDRAEPIDQLSSKTPLTLDEAYAVQAAGIVRRSERGDLPVGVKLGFTSREKAEQMGVHDVILGVLTAAMSLEQGASLDLGDFVHPRIEPEIAFLLAPGVDDLDLSSPQLNLLDHVTHVAAAVEIIDSRYRNFRFNLPDVVADNTSAARFRVGAWRELSPATDRVADRSVVLSGGGAVAASGSTSAILGDPLHALAAAQRLARRYGHRLPSSAIILAGAATAAVPMRPACGYQARVEGLGAVEVRTAPRSER